MYLVNVECLFWLKKCIYPIHYGEARIVCFHQCLVLLGIFKLHSNQNSQHMLLFDSPRLVNICDFHCAVLVLLNLILIPKAIPYI